jgi:uncharacterized protein with PIN domain
VTRLLVAEELRPFLRRHQPKATGIAPVDLAADPTATLGHAVQAAGIPLTEVGALIAEGAPVRPATRVEALPSDVRVEPRMRPQPLDGPERLLLDVHLGALARRLRLLGVDTAYRNDANDAELVAEALSQDRLLLTQDRGLLQRRSLRRAAYVRGARADDQLADVLDRFPLQLKPFSRCTTCNGTLAPVAKVDIVELLEPGTKRTQENFARCDRCGRVYWHGAHGARLRTVVERYAPQPTLE